MTQRLSASRSAVGRHRIPVDYPEEAQCSLPLECHVFMRRGQGAISFTRATPATVQDHEGVIRYVKSGEARFQGARRVENLHTYSEDITNAVWSAASCTRIKDSGVAPDGTITAGLVTSNAATALTEFNQNYNIVSGKTYIFSVSLKANGGLQYVQILGNSATFGSGYINIDLSNGTVATNVPGAANIQVAITPEANGFYRIQAKATAISTLASNHLSVAMVSSGSSIRADLFTGDGVKGFYYWHPQFEDVTGQSVQTAGEYVSTNVLAGAFHGAMVDGVRYFNTRLDGTYIEGCGYLPESATTNLCTQSEDFTTTWTLNGGGSVTAGSTASPGLTKASTFTLSPTAGSQFLYFPFTPTAQRYGVSIRMKTNGHHFWQIATSSVNGTGYANFDISNGATGNTSGFLIKTKALKDGWYEIKVTTTTLTAVAGGFAISAISSLTNGRLPSSAGTGVSGAYLWGFQIEAGVPTSYIPTSGATATRNDDILTIDLANTQSTQGTWFADTTIDLPSSTISALSITGRVFGSITTLPGVYWNTNGQISFHDGANTTNTSNSYIANGINKVAYGFSGSTMTAGLNGTNTSGTFDGTHSFAALCIGNTTTVSRGLLGTIRNVQLWGYRLSDADIALITKP